MIITEFGSINVEIIRAKNIFFPGNRNRANPKATKEQDITVRTTVGITRRKVFLKYVAKVIFPTPFQPFLNASKEKRLGRSFVEPRISPLVLKQAKIIHTKGKVITAPMTISKKYAAPLCFFLFFIRNHLRLHSKPRHQRT